MARLEFGGNVRRTFCSMCPAQCGMLVEVDGNAVKAVKVLGDKNNPISNGRLCPKGPKAMEYNNHPQRLNYPQKRVGARGENRWQRISWDEALDEIADKLRKLRDSHGPEMLATMGGTHMGPGDWSNWRFSCSFGTPNFINQGRNCGVGEIVTSAAMFGWDTKMGFPVPGLTKCAVLWGANTESAPYVMPAFREVQKAGGKVIVVDPRTTDIARIADVHLKVKPRTDGALLLGMIHIMINENLYDKEFVDKWCLGFDEVKKSVAEWTPQRASEICGIPAETIIKATRMYADNRPARIQTGVALIQAGQGAALSNVRALDTLKAISGNLDAPGGDLMGGPYDPNMFEWHDNVGFDRLLDHPLRTRESVNAAYTPICSISGYRASREAMAKVYPKGLGGAEYQLFADPSAVYHAVLEQKPYPIKAIILQGGNPLLTMGGGKTAEKAFRSPNLELLVAVDHWLTPSAQLADYVLPAADFLERPDICAHWGIMNSFVVGQQSIEPQFERRNDYEFWAGLGRRMLDPADWPESLYDMFDRFLAPSGKTFREWAEGESNLGMQMPQWKKYEKQGFATASGKVELIPSLFTKLGIDASLTYKGPPYALPDVDNEADYPLQMIPGSRVKESTASRMHAIESLRKLHPEPLVDIHPETAACYGIKDGDWVLIERPEGAIRQKARLTDDMRLDTIHPEGYWWEPGEKPGLPGLSGAWTANANSITPAQLSMSSFAGDQLLRGMRCRLRKAEC